MAALARIGFAAALACACLLTTAARAADSVSGTWNFTVDIAGNQGTPTFTLKQEGDKVTGKYKGQFGESDVKGTVKEKDIELTFDIEGGAGKVVYKGTIDGDTMKGTCDYAGQADGTWTAKKAEE